MLGGPVRGLQYVGVPSCMRMGPSRRCFRYVFRESDRGMCPQELLSIRDPLHWTQGSLLYFSSIVPNIVPNKDHKGGYLGDCIQGVIVGLIEEVLGV